MTEKRSFQDSPVVTRVITFRGTVQGVGFRPTVAALARSLSMVGSVCNMGGSVQLVVTDTPDRIDAFVRAIEDNKPAMSDISRVECRTAETVRFRAFTIKRSYASGVGSVAVPADIAVCGDCLREFYDRDNPRYKHPFISCAVCGPRFTIMERLPYDRDTTSMDDFEMCAFCADAYEDIKDRRFHAQTISCHDCGPMAEWFSVDQPSGAAYTPDESIAEAIDALRRGGVVAVKCVGGYCFACDPFSAAAVRKTRDIKVREEKPFAILFRDADAACLYCAARAEEYELLRSPARPIVLLERLQSETPPGGLFDPGVSGDSRFIGAFLPSMGLQYLLSDALGPLVMTSANLSGLPIIKDDDEMRALVLRDRRVAGMLYNRRRIVMRADDSVARVVDGTPQLIRRSKGYAPTPVTVRGVEALTSDDRIFAAGGQLKAAFSLSRGNLAYMSQYMGDLSDAESENVYRDNFHRMKRFFDAAPDLIVRDMHPLYHTTKFAEGYAENAARARRRSGCGEADCDAPEVLAVQHHHAHAASVMAEHGLDGPIIGVSFDGTGYGSDGKIWGGEILLCEGEGFTRFSHLGYVRMIGGDASMKEGWKSAVSHVMDRKEKGAREPTDADGSATFDIDLSDIIAYGERNRTLAAFERIPQIEAAIRAGVGTVESSSMGRLFDGVASLLGIRHINRYEGECAIMLENAAARAAVRAERDDGAGKKDANWDEADELALRFHRDAAAAVLSQCDAARAACGATRVALSGGVFQNGILMEETLALLRRAGFSVYYNVAVPPNDGGIALGQNYIGMKHLLAQRENRGDGR